MKATFSYIEEVLDREIEGEKNSPKITTKDRQDAEEKSRKLIAGFRVKDEQEERAYLDKIIAARIGDIKKFMDDRIAVKNRLEKVGVSPLAIVPTKAWENICIKSGLFILTPDKQNKVKFNYDTVRTINNPEKVAKANWSAFLRKMFPNQKSNDLNSHYTATLKLPDPPKEVAEVLCKAQSLTLKVAAEAAAISFLETPTQIGKRANVDSKDLWAQSLGYADYKDWVKRDPIIYTESGSAAAIIAQFGEFPIEKAVVDAVCKSEDLLDFKASPEVNMVLTAGNGVLDYKHYIQQSRVVLTQAPLGYYISDPTHTHSIVNSSTWTGR